VRQLGCLLDLHFSLLALAVVDLSGKEGLKLFGHQQQRRASLQTDCQVIDFLLLALAPLFQFLLLRLHFSLLALAVVDLSGKEGLKLFGHQQQRRASLQTDCQVIDSFASCACTVALFQFLLLRLHFSLLALALVDLSCQEGLKSLCHALLSSAALQLTAR